MLLGGIPFTGILFSHTTHKPAVYINNGKPVSREVFYLIQKSEKEAKRKRDLRIKRLRRISKKLVKDEIPCDECIVDVLNNGQ